MDGFVLWRSILRAVFLAFSLSFASLAIATPVIQEVYYDLPGSDASGVFTEIYADPGLSLNDWQLVGINGSTGLPYRTVTFTNLFVPTDGFVVISTTQASIDLASVSDYQDNVDWQNGVDALQLWSASGELVDAIQYGSLSGFFAGEGDPAVDISPGFSLSRQYAGYDTNDNLNDFLVLDTPTPGTALAAPSSNFISVPISNSATLLMCGLLALVFSYPTRNRAIA